MKQYRIKSWFLCGLILAVMPVLFSGCTQRAGSREIVIGHIAPLTGDAAMWGKWEVEGINLAVEQINAKGGIDGSKIRIINEDDKADPKTAVSALQKLISTDHVKAVIGATLSSPTLACAPVAQQNKVVLLSPSAQSPKLAQAGDYIFKLFASNQTEGKNLVKLAEEFQVRSVALLYLNNDYGLGLRSVISQLLAHKKMNILDEEKYDGDAKDFRTAIEKVKAARPDAIFLLGYPSDMARVLLQMKQLGLKAKVFAPDAFEAEEITKIAKNAAEGVLYVYPIVPKSENSENVKKLFKDKYNKEMNIYNAVGYDSVKLLAYAIEQSLKTKGKIEGEYVRDALFDIKNFPGISGAITFGKNGWVMDRPMETRIVRNGKFEPFK